MPDDCLLDTVAVVAYFANDSDLIGLVNSATSVSVSSTVVDELYYGALKSTRAADNISRLENFVPLVRVLTCDLETARQYGRIERELRLKGRPIPSNDVWIAAIAQQHGLTLVTRDTHFNEVTGLSISTW